MTFTHVIPTKNQMESTWRMKCCTGPQEHPSLQKKLLWALKSMNDTCFGSSGSLGEASAQRVRAKGLGFKGLEFGFKGSGLRVIVTTTIPQ